MECALKVLAHDRNLALTLICEERRRLGVLELIMVGNRSLTTLSPRSLSRCMLRANVSNFQTPFPAVKSPGRHFQVDSLGSTYKAAR